MRAAYAPDTQRGAFPCRQSIFEIQKTQGQQGITFGIAYTLSKTQTTISDDGTFTRLVNPSLDYALAAFDRTHYLVGNFVWDLPKGSKLFGGNKVAGVVLDHWVISGVTTRMRGFLMLLILAAIRRPLPRSTPASLFMAPARAVSEGPRSAVR